MSSRKKEQSNSSWSENDSYPENPTNNDDINDYDSVPVEKPQEFRKFNVFDPTSTQKISKYDYNDPYDRKTDDFQEEGYNSSQEADSDNSSSNDDLYNRENIDPFDIPRKSNNGEPQFTTPQFDGGKSAGGKSKFEELLKAELKGKRLSELTKEDQEKIERSMRGKSPYSFCFVER